MTNSNVMLFSAYRELLRELVKSSTGARSRQNSPIMANIRRALLGKASEGQDFTLTLRNIGDTTSFLRAQRTHKELLERYGPLHDLTEQERVRATARRVGLDTPVQYKP